MKITRRFTKPGKSPYEGADAIAVSFPDRSPYSLIKHQLSNERLAQEARTIEFPAHWSAAARDLCLSECFVHDGIACDLVPVVEDDVPTWLWRSEPSATATTQCGETSLIQVIDRLSGGWTYLGWKGGYFDSEEDALTYFDECRWLLFHQKISPAISHWRHSGRFWAYGHDMSVPATYVTDYRKGSVRRAAETDLPPLSFVINTTEDVLAGEGGVWDLWRREGDVLSKGGSCGVNVSNILSAGSAGSGSGLTDILDIGDNMARAASPGSSRETQKRRVTIDEAHPASDSLIRRPIEKMAAAEAETLGTTLARRHVEAILDACTQEDCLRRSARNDGPSATLRMALQSARQALLPERLIERTLCLAKQGLAKTAADIISWESPGPAGNVSDAVSDAITVVRVDDEASPENATHDSIFARTATAAWSGIESGVHFRSQAEAWNTCPSAGAIRSAAGDGSFMFLDDTAADPWFISPSIFFDADLEFDVAGYRHAVEMLTVAADISLMAATAVTPRLARRVWDFRPLSLSITGMGDVLISAGLSYDSGAGRALCAGLNALLTSTAYHMSARMAQELGAFPEYAENAPDMLRVLDQHRDLVATYAHEASPPGLVEAIEEAWSATLLLGTREGFRNAQISALCADKEISTLLNVTSCGVAPLNSLTIGTRSQAGYYEEQINPAVPQALRKLGYSVSQINAIIQHIVGRGTLAKAPGVNHETLRKRGFTDAAIQEVESTLPMINDISLAFDPFILGMDYCRHMLGFSDSELQDDAFDMLAALGFSDAGIEAANISCFGAGTPEGAPHLSPDHLAVFDCAEPQGTRGTRFVTTDSIVKMMGALQPHISGAIGQTLYLPAETLPQDGSALLERAQLLGVKSITLVRSAPALTTEYPAADQEDLALPAFTVVDGEQVALSASEITPSSAINVPSGTSNRTNAADGVESTTSGSKASRRASSHAARRAASVSSSADAVSSNGMFDVASP